MVGWGIARVAGRASVKEGRWVGMAAERTGAGVEAPGGEGVRVGFALGRGGRCAWQMGSWRVCLVMV